jgi:structure-specific endonuclease subunit SLX1
MAYVCYLLRSVSDPAQSYVGSTNNMARRLRQHNGELAGGARCTHRNRPWEVAALVRGFRTHSEVLRFEARWKQYTRRHRLHGAEARTRVVQQWLLTPTMVDQEHDGTTFQHLQLEI